MSVTEEYLEYTKKHLNDYGEKSIVLMKVGAFYEMYGLKNASNMVIGSKVEIICKMCDLQLSERSNMFHNTMPVLIAGFRDYCLEKYVEKITSEDYTCFVYDQYEIDKKFHRKLVNIYSRGTYFNTNETELQNVTMCVWYEKVSNNTIVFGISHINILTGQTHICEYEERLLYSPTTFDNLERYLSIYNPSEIIMITNLSREENERFTHMLHIQTQNQRTIFIDDNSSNFSRQAKNCSKQTYIREIVTDIFHPNDYNVFMMKYSRYTMALQSFAFLCNWVKQHNEYLLHKIGEPIIETGFDTLYLANHSLKQLNIIHDTKMGGKQSSLSTMLNNCVTPMGKREFVERLVHPTYNVDVLNYEYENIDNVLQNYTLVYYLRGEMRSMYDMERLQRQLFLGKLLPKNVACMYNDIQSTLKIHKHVSEQHCYLDDYLSKFVDVSEYCESIIQFISSSMDVETLKTSDAITDTLFVKGYDSKLDDIVCETNINYGLLLEYQRVIQNIFIKIEKKDVNYIKVHSTDKMPPSLTCTQKRSIVLKNYLDTHPVEFTYNGSKISLNSGFTFPKSTAGSVMIHHTDIQSCCERYYYKKQEMLKYIEIVFSRFCDEIKAFHEPYMKITTFAVTMDVLQNKAYMAHKYNYCRPLAKSGSRSSVDAHGVRHAIIEHINQDETYVKNDISLNKQRNGMLLFGTNAVGKTSFMKALGICIIMAQSGLFVPCDKFDFVPYTQMFTRILNNDNMFKGLSTFAVEMSELRVILQSADERSIVLGDELCSGTEYESATSIFVTGIQWLHKQDVSFIFATHLHNIAEYEEITSIESVTCNHMSVIYDTQNDCLVYDRLLKDGSGSSMYGLEVCKSLHLPLEFLENAHMLRNKYLDIVPDILSKETSRYNSKKIRNQCEICKINKATEVHHLLPQHSADSRNFIGHVHKNHMANLASICEPCHQKIHHENYEMRRTKTTNGYIFTLIK